MKSDAMEASPTTAYLDSTGYTARTPNWRSALSAALFAFILSRLLIVFSAASAIAVSEQWSGPDNAQTNVRLFTPKSNVTLESRLLSNDATWYLGIAKDGYEQRPFDTHSQANWAFFPLYPYLWRTLNAAGLPPMWAGVLLSNAFFLIALIQFHRWVQLITDESTASRGVLCIALFPTSYFFSLPWTESLFLLLASSSLLSMELGRWGRSSIINALASATRPNGLFLAALMWWRARGGSRFPPVRIWVLSLVGCTGLLGFMAILWIKTGHPLAFSEIQVTWGRDGGSLTKHLRRWLTDPLWLAEAWNVRLINNGALLLGIAGSVWLWRHKLRALAVFSFMCLLLPWSTGTLLSMGRYVAACPPLFLAFASWGESPRGWIAWLTICTCLLVGMSACFALGANFAGT